ncbi:MAG: outer membrane beta-barrel family protein [Flavobacteriaceae bacterium]
MRLIYPLLVLSMLCSIPLLSQTAQVSGMVRDGMNESIPFASVFLLQVSDSSVVKGASADENGLFVIENVLPDLYFIRASYIGKTSDLIAIDINGEVKIGALIIDQAVEILDEVVVNSVKPLIERKADRLLFNVENSVASQGSSWEVLKRTPGVIAVQDNLQVRNQSVTVYINDRKVQLSSQEVRSLLENLSGAQIKLIEVINNPPAKYDAEGGPVLNIVMAKNIALGYKGNVSSTITQSIFPKYTFGTAQFYKTSKLNVFASYTYGPSKEFKNVESNINFIDDTGIFSRWGTDFDKTTRAKTHNGLLNLDYAFDDRNELRLASNILLSPDKTFDQTQVTEMRNRLNVLDSTFITGSNLLEDKNNLSADLTYIHRFKEEGNLSLNGQYTKFNYDLTQAAVSNYFDPQDQFIRAFAFFTDATQEVDIYTAQLDISSKMGSVSYETGFKGSFIDSRSGLGFYNVLGTGRVFNAALSDDYRYEEKVYAGYFSLAKEWEKFSIKAGLRAEQTFSKGSSLSLSSINDLRYLELFPSLYLLHSIDENHSLSFDYSRKLGRPRYEDLNPFRVYINENNFVEGNPNLTPFFSHNFNLNYTLKGEFFFDLYYRDNGNYISTLAFQDNVNLTLRDITQNVLASTSYGFDFNYGKTVAPWWSLYTYISIFHEEETFLALESNNQRVINEVDGAYIDLSNYFTFSKDGSFRGELGITYLSGFLEGSYKQSETTNLVFGLRKSFWDQRALLSIQANDLLNKVNPSFTSRYLNQDNGFLSRPETQYVRMALTVNFGNFRLADNQRAIEKIERERLEPK